MDGEINELFALMRWGTVDNVRNYFATHADADPNKKLDSHGNTAIYYALGINEVPLLDVLLHYGAHINVRNDDGETPLDSFVRHRYFEPTKPSMWQTTWALIDRGAIAATWSVKNNDMVVALTAQRSNACSAAVLVAGLLKRRFKFGRDPAGLVAKAMYETRHQVEWRPTPKPPVQEVGKMRQGFNIMLLWVIGLIIARICMTHKWLFLDS